MKICRTSPSWVGVFSRRTRRRALAGDDNRESTRHRPAAGRLALAGIAVALLARCSPEKPAGPGADYAGAKDDFAKGQSVSYDKAVATLETLGDANPPNAYTDRARVLRAVILAGRVEADLKLSDDYAKGAEVTKNPQARSDDSRLRQDTLQLGAEQALKLGQLAMDLTKGGTFPKDLSLDALPGPAPPASIPALDKVREGLAIGPDDHAEAALDAQRLAIADALADLVRADRDTARSKMTAGPVPLSSTEFALFLTKELVAGASLFDKKHLNNPTRFKLIAGVADGTANAAAAALKQTPDADQAKRLKKLQDQIKSGVKASSMVV